MKVPSGPHVPHVLYKSDNMQELKNVLWRGTPVHCSLRLSLMPVTQKNGAWSLDMFKRVNHGKYMRFASKSRELLPRVSYYKLEESTHQKMPILPKVFGTSSP